MAFEEYKSKFKFDVANLIKSTHGCHWNELSNTEQDQVLLVVRSARHLEIQTSLTEFIVNRLNFKFSLEDENPKVLFRVFTKSYEFHNASKIIPTLPLK